MDLNDPMDMRVVIHALNELAEQSDNDILAEHAHNLAVELGWEYDIEPEKAGSKLPYQSTR